MSAITIRPLDQADQAEWRRLWTDYLTFYETKGDFRIAMRRTPGMWDLETLEQGVVGGVTGAVASSMAFDATGRLNLVYYHYNLHQLRYLTRCP